MPSTVQSVATSLIAWDPLTMQQTLLQCVGQAAMMRTLKDLCGYAWSELFYAIQSHLAADALKEECTDDTVSLSSTPQKQKAVVSDGAQVSYTLAQVQAAYYLGQQNHNGVNNGSFKVTAMPI